MIILFIAGCNFSREGPITATDIYKGQDGLLMNFLENAPPAEVFEDSPFRVYVELENRGAFDILDGYLALGLEDDYMSINRGWSDLEPSRIEAVDEKHVIFDLNGKSLENSLGEENIITVIVDALKIKEEQSERHTSDVLMTACYEYQTKAAPTVCVDTNIYELKPVEKSCTVKDVDLTSQGAPLAVTLVEVEMLPEENKIKPHFLIHIENKGNGEVVRKGKIEQACYSGELDYSDTNIVYVEAFLSDKQLNCEPKKENDDLKSIVKLKDKKAIARCFTKDDDAISKEEGTYTTPLKITLDYGYTFTISKSVTIKKVLTY